MPCLAKCALPDNTTSPQPLNLKRPPLLILLTANQQRQNLTRQVHIPIENESHHLQIKSWLVTLEETRTRRSSTDMSVQCSAAGCAKQVQNGGAACIKHGTKVK